MVTQEELKKEINEKIKEYYTHFLTTKRNSVPVSGKRFDEQEIIKIVDAALEGWWTEGSISEEFEKKFCEYLGVKNTIVVNSGSSANLVAFKTLTSKKLGDRRLKPGDEVITVAAGFPTTINPIIESGCIPVFCDVDLGTFGINIEDLENAITPKTKAIMMAHTLGNPFNLNKVLELCKKHKLWLVEDNCDALGSMYDGKRTGTFGDLSTFSFYPAHQITMGEGGAVCVNHPLLAKIARSIRDWGRDCWCKTGMDNTCNMRFDWQLGHLPKGYDHKYVYSEIGYNLKNTDLNVAIGLAQLDKLDSFIETRQKNFDILLSGLSQFEEHFIMPKAEENSVPCWFGFPLTIKENAPFSRNDLIAFLTEKKIGTRLLFAGNITKQPYFVDYDIPYRVVNNLDKTDIVMTSTFWVGVSPILEDGDAEKIVEAISEFIGEVK